MTISIVRREPAEHDLPADLHPVIAIVYAARNLCRADELERSLKSLHSFTLLKSIDTAIALLSDAIEQQKKVLIVADFDVLLRIIIFNLLTELRLYFDYEQKNRIIEGCSQLVR